LKVGLKKHSGTGTEAIVLKKRKTLIEDKERGRRVKGKPNLCQPEAQ